MGALDGVQMRGVNIQTDIFLVGKRKCKGLVVLPVQVMWLKANVLMPQRSYSNDGFSE